MKQRTNRANYPPVICAAIDGEQAAYLSEDRGWITATTLIGPPQIRLLLAEHGDNLTRDYADDRHTFHGSIMHAILEKYGKLNPDDLVEVRCGSVYRDKRLTGKFDRYDAELHQLQDYKETSAWAVLDGPKKEWIEQLNVNAQLLEDDLGITPKSLAIIALLKDHDPTRAKQFRYPDHDIVTIDIPLWSREARIAFINWRMEVHLQAEAKGTAICTDEEQWREESTYAVKKTASAVKATRVYDNSHEAYAHAESMGGMVEVRRGRPVRCLGTRRLKKPYCPVCSVCPQLAREESSKCT